MQTQVTGLITESFILLNKWQKTPRLLESLSPPDHMHQADMLVSVLEFLAHSSKEGLNQLDLTVLQASLK